MKKPYQTKSIFLGGPFLFHYKDYTDELLRNDYRSKVIGFERFKTSPDEETTIKLSESTTYIGPFFFYQGRPNATSVVDIETSMISACTDAFFLIGTKDMPGTITELIHAALKGKNIFIYYVKERHDTGEPGRSFRSPQWYPLTFVQEYGLSQCEIHGFDSYAEAESAIIRRIKSYV